MIQLWLQTARTLQPWEIDARFPYHEALGNALSKVPGIRREGTGQAQTHGVKRWVIPEDVLPLAVEAARSVGVSVLDHRTPTGNFKDARRCSLALQPWEVSPRFPQQWDAALAASMAPAFLVQFSMGLGKTWSAITALRLRRSKMPVVVCPAMAREVWAREIVKWWPDTAAETPLQGQPADAPAHGATSAAQTLGNRRPLIKVLRDSAISVRGRKRRNADAADSASLADVAALAAADQRGLVIVLSYGLLHTLQPLLDAGALDGVDAVVCDEIHYLQNPKAQRTQALFGLRERLPKAWRLGLTGTVVTNHVDSMWCPLDWLFPARFGKIGSFQWRYMNPVPQHSKSGEFQGYAYKPKAPVDGGLKTAAELAEAQQELRARLEFFSVRVTKKDVAHLLPPFSVTRLDADNAIKDAASLVKDALDEGTTHVRVMCYLHETADALAALLAQQFPDTPLEKVDGREDALHRDRRIEALKKRDTGILVATISSTQVAIDLVQFTTAIYAELSPKLVENIQSLGRGHRLSSTHPSSVIILTDAKGDRRARLMADKVDALNAIMKAGTEEGGLATALGGLRDAEMSDEDFNAVTAAIMENFFDDLGEG